MDIERESTTEKIIIKRYSPEYLASQKDVVKRNFEQRQIYWNTARFRILREFCSNFKKVLSVGCGAYEPCVINATHATDVASEAEVYLRQLGWQGEFKLGDCCDLPYPAKSFDVVVMSEVIEHLPDMADVVQAFLEVNEVGKNWVVTTPCNPLGSKNPEPDHKRAFNAEQLRQFGDMLFQDELYFYVVKCNGREGLDAFARIFDKHARLSAKI